MISEGETEGSAEKLPYEDNKFDLVTAVETVYFWPNLPNCLKEVKRVMKPGARFAIMVEVLESDSVWTDVVDGMTAYSPEQLKKCLTMQVLSRRNSTVRSHPIQPSSE